ncbi:MAG: CoA-binding protein [Sphingomonadales bacterium]|nr:CoA-binding protein [Sphingomonadales bacterium]
MNHDSYADSYLRDILTTVKTIAVVGASDDDTRPVYGVMRFLQSRGYRAIPVNPRLAGKKLMGETVYGALGDIPDKIDMVDIFRRKEDLPAVFDDAIVIAPAVIWTQLGLRDDASAAKAEAAGVKVVMNHCPAIEIPRLGI